MFEKMFRFTKINQREIKLIEDKVFEKENSTLVKDIMFKKRNIMIIKNMFKPQVFLFKQLENVINQMYL